MSTEQVTVTSEFLRSWPLPRPDGSKHSRGHVLVVGGGPSTPGAAMLAGLAALRVGAGVLALVVAESTVPAVAVAVPEASVAGPADLAARMAASRYVLVGPGLDDPGTTQDLLAEAVGHADDETRFVLDAFALGVLADSPARRAVAGRVILTPNAAEVERLLEGKPMPDGEAAARAVAEKFDAVVAFHGHVADPGGRYWRVAAGHPGLGTSGSGDVLAGAVTGLLARGAEPAQAAAWGSYLHAVAGERLAARVGRLGFLARELAAQLPVVLTETEA